MVHYGGGGDSSGRWNSMVSGLDKHNHHLPTVLVDSVGERKEGKKERYR